MASPTFSSTSPSTINQNVITLFIGVVVLFLVRCFLIEFNKKRYNLPPGPKPFPIIGNLPQIIRAKEFFTRILEFRKIYGGIFKISIGPFSSIFVSDLDIMKEGLITKGELVNGRPTWLFAIKKIFNKKAPKREKNSKEQKKINISEEIISHPIEDNIFVTSFCNKKWGIKEKKGFSCLFNEC